MSIPTQEDVQKAYRAWRFAQKRQRAATLPSKTWREEEARRYAEYERIRRAYEGAKVIR